MNNDNVQDPPQQALAQRLALWAGVLRDCSARGLHFASNIYDRGNYQKVQDIALELFALASGQLLTDIEPLRSTIFARPAPFPTGDGAVIDDNGRILLIRRADNGLWAMPGGGLEVGETPVQGVLREVLEETGVTCEPVALFCPVIKGKDLVDALWRRSCTIYEQTLIKAVLSVSWLPKELQAFT